MAIARIDEIVGAANNTTTPYDISVGSPASTLRGVCVIIVQHASAADQVISVTYGTGAGAVILTERRFIPISSEAGAVYIYWGSGVTFPTGAQTVRIVKTAATADLRAAVCRQTSAVDTQVSVDFDTQSVSTTSVANPSWAHNTVVAATECYFGWCSDLNAITGIAIGANWTSLATIVDEGNQQIVFGRRTMTSAGNALPAVTAPTEGYAGGSISFKEIPLPVTLAGLGVAQGHSTLQAGPTPTLDGADGFLTYTAAGTSIGVPAPAGAATGKVAGVRILREYATASPPSTHPALSGWVEASFRSESQGTDTIDQTILLRELTGSEGATYTFTWTGSAIATATSHAISGADKTNLATLFEDIEHIGAATAQTAVITTVVDTIGLNRLALWLAAGYGGNSAWTVPTSFTERSDRVNMGTGTLGQATAGTVTASGASNGSTDRKIAFLGTIRPAWIPMVLTEQSGATNLAGLNVAQVQAASNITLVVESVDRRARIIGQSFVPIDTSTW